MCWVENGNLRYKRVQILVPVIVLPKYSRTYIYTTYSQNAVANTSWCNMQSLSHTCTLMMGLWHWFIYPIPGPHSKLQQWVCDTDSSISFAYIAHFLVKYGNGVLLGSDNVALTGHSDKVALTRLLWQVALTGCSDNQILLKQAQMPNWYGRR